MAVMCAEAVPWRCHRSLIADALLVRGIRSEEIVSPTRTQVHVLTSFAEVDGSRIFYPQLSTRIERRKLGNSFESGKNRKRGTGQISRPDNARTRRPQPRIDV